jgi:uncharacterized membrane protein
MAQITEEVEIKAPAERVWKVVHEDVANAPRWSSHLRRVELVDGEPPARGSRLRYHLDLPGGLKETLEVEHTTFNPPKKAAGKFVGGPLRGTWSYSYREKDGLTRLSYDMDYQLTGLLRFAGGLLARQYADAIRKSMAALKKYIESGKGPGGAARSALGKASARPRKTPG